MFPPSFRKRLYEALWAEDCPPGERVFAILDGAQDTRIFGAVDGSRQDKHCLYSSNARWWPGGDVGWELIGVAPYLVEMEKDAALTNFVLKEGWANHWGIFLRSDSRIDRLRRHF